MSFEHVISVYSLVLNVIALMICLFQYISRPRRSWSYAIIFFLSNLLSNYYWCIYMLVMGDYPNASSILAYFGWNIAFLVLPILQYGIRYKEEKGFFSIWSLIPIPLNFIQFLIYIQYGGIFNNLWQGGFATLSACMGINSIIYYLKNKKSGAKKPYVAAVVVLYIFTEHVMWTSSCYSWPSEYLYPYNYASILDGFVYIMLPFSIVWTYRLLGEDKPSTNPALDHLQKVFKPMFMSVVVTCCFGGYLLALWMRNTLLDGINSTGEADPFKVIAVMLFVVSLIIVFFALSIILVVNLENKSAESEELKEAKTVAERSNAAKSDFLANMSHEIRTPLNAVLGMNEMILIESMKGRDELPDDDEKVKSIFSDICNYSGNIDSAGNSLLSIINDILDLSKIEAGKMEIVNADYKLSSIINDVSNMIAFKAKAKDLQFKVDVEPIIPDDLNGDEVRIRQVITNLLNNAVKYTKDGTISLNIRGKRYDDEDREGDIDLVITVKDTGIGIRQEDIDRLFTKFERMDLESNSTIEGTGLGLTITRSLLEMMGGSIEVESKYGTGSEFTVVIPQKIVADDPIGDFREKFEKTINEKNTRKETLYAPHAHILIVDDTRMNLMVAKGLLRNTGINIDTADSGREAIELASEKSYDIILMDQRMPEMDGITAMRKIKERKYDYNAHTPFICLTADAVSGARERYIAEGFDDYLTKPIDSTALEEMIKKYLPKDKLAASTDAKEVVDDSLGLFYSNDDETFYKAILQEYMEESKKLIPAIEQHYADKDWENYGIRVHSLKSTSKIIGATGLFELAASVEAAAKAPDIDAVYRDHDKLMELYKTVLDSVAARL